MGSQEKIILHNINKLPESKYIKIIKELKKNPNKNSIKINYLKPISNVEINNKEIKNINGNQEENKEEFLIKQNIKYRNLNDDEEKEENDKVNKNYQNERKEAILKMQKQQNEDFYNFKKKKNDENIYPFDLEDVQENEKEIKRKDKVKDKRL